MMPPSAGLLRSPILRDAPRSVPWIPQVVVMGGGRGGVGTSTVSVLSALEAAARGAQTLLVDLDEGGAALPLLLGMDPTGPAGSGPASAAERVVPIASNLAFLPLGTPPGDPAPGGALRRVRIRRAARLYRHFDLVVVDGGSRLASVAAALESGAGRFVAVSTLDRVAFAASHALFKVVTALAPHLPLELVPNRTAPGDGERVHQVVASAARTFLGRTVELATAIPEDPALGLPGGALPLPFLPPDTPAREAAALPLHRWMGR